MMPNTLTGSMARVFRLVGVLVSPIHCRMPAWETMSRLPDFCLILDWNLILTLNWGASKQDRHDSMPSANRSL
jgi:hypothetical protein